MLNKPVIYIYTDTKKYKLSGLSLYVSGHMFIMGGISVLRDDKFRPPKELTATGHNTK
jgi:hypothetical protein